MIAGGHSLQNLHFEGGRILTIMKIKNCPFCGGESRLFETGFHSWIVACTKCCCRTHEEESEEDAIRIWNIRVRK